MSSTEYKVNRKDVLFLLNEVLQAEKLCELPDYSDFNQELFNMIVNEASNFAEKRIGPLNSLGDQVGCQLIDGKVVTPEGFKEAWKEMGEGGWNGLSMPEKFGGQGLPELINVAAQEVMMAANQGFMLTATLTSGAANLIRVFGSEEQKDTYCEKMYTGQWTGTMCLSEPDAGSAVGDITTTATKNGDHYLIKGSKCWITGGDIDYGENIIHLVLARTPDAPEGTKGISLFIVPKVRMDGTPNDTQVVSIEGKMGIHGSPTCVMSYGDQDDCHGYLLKEENKGMSQMFQLMNEARLFVALQGLSGSGAAYENALAYATERIQGIGVEHGKNPSAPKAFIVDHPDVRRMIMQMKALTEGMRGMMYQCAYFTDMIHRGPQEMREHYQDLLDLHIPIAKAFCTDQGFQVACTGIQVLGGVGYTHDYPLEQNARDLKISSIYEGTNGIQSLDLVGRKFAMKNGALVFSLKKELDSFDEETLPTEIQTLVEEWKTYRDMMFSSIQNLQKLAEVGGPRGYVLYAVNIQELMGDVLSCFYLLKQSLVAQRKLNELVADRSLEEVLAENPEARYYHDKVGTGEFYVYSILPRVMYHAKVINNGSFSPLEARFDPV